MNDVGILTFAVPGNMPYLSQLTSLVTLTTNTSFQQHPQNMCSRIARITSSTYRCTNNTIELLIARSIPTIHSREGMEIENILLE